MGNDLVREARRRAGITQAELARRVGSTQPAIARLESGRTRPTFDRVVELLRACGFDLHVHLGSPDDSDMAQARALAELTSEQRLDHLVTTVRRLEDLRAMADDQLAHV